MQSGPDSPSVGYVSVQFLWLQISTFDKVPIPMITHFPGNKAPHLLFLEFPFFTHAKDKIDRMDLMR